MFTIVKRFYDRNIYDDKDVAKFVAVGKLTADEYRQITGKALQ